MASIRRRKDRKSGWIVDCRDVPGGHRVTVATREEAELLRAKFIQEAQQAMPSAQDRDITGRCIRGPLAEADRGQRRATDARMLHREPQVTHLPCVR